MQQISISTKTQTPAALSITDRVKTFEDACRELKIDGDVFSALVHDTLKNDAGAIEAHFKLIVITKALNEGWTPDWSDEDEYKYYPWWRMESGFELDDVDCNYTSSSVGSRLCFKSGELAEYAAKQFADLYKQYFVIN